MKSIKQVPITHPTKKVLLRALKDIRDDNDRLDFAVKWIWSDRSFKDDGTTVWNMTLPVPNKTENAWQLITYEIRNKEDYKEYKNKLKEVTEIIDWKVKNECH